MHIRSSKYLLSAVQAVSPEGFHVVIHGAGWMSESPPLQPRGVANSLALPHIYMYSALSTHLTLLELAFASPLGRTELLGALIHFTEYLAPALTLAIESLPAGLTALVPLGEPY